MQDPLKVFGTITRYVLAGVACLSFFQFVFFISNSSDEAQYKAGMAIGRAVICGVIAGVWFYRASREKQLNAFTEHSDRARLSTATEKPIPTEQPKVISTPEPPQESHPPVVEAKRSQAPGDGQMVCDACGKQFSGEFSFCPYCGKPLDAKPPAGIASPPVPVVEHQTFTDDSVNHPESVGSTVAGSGIQTGTIVFGAFSAISLVVSIFKGIVPIFLLEAAGWAGAAWYWQSRKKHSDTAKGVVIVLAVVVVVGEIIHVALAANSQSAPAVSSVPYYPYANTPGESSTPSTGGASSTPDAAEIEQQAVALYKQKQYSEARPLFDQACNGGDMRACNYLGYMCARGLGGAQSLQTARDVYEKACDQGTLSSCASLGSLYQDSGNNDEARNYFKKACDGGLNEGCTLLHGVQ